MWLVLKLASYRLSVSMVRLLRICWLLIQSISHRILVAKSWGYGFKELTKGCLMVCVNMFHSLCSLHVGIVVMCVHVWY